jgi:hypothetical protein
MMMKLFWIGITYWLVWPAHLCFGLTLFRFKLKPLIPHIIFTTLAMSCLSVFLQTTSFVYLLSIVQFLGLIVFVWLIFRISLIHSIILNIFAYSIAYLSEDLMNFLIPSTYITFVTEGNMVWFFTTGIAYASFFVVYIVILRTTRLGFSFIVRPKNRTRKLTFNYSGPFTFKIVLVTSFTAMMLDSLFYFLYPGGMAVISALILTAIAVLLRISYRWEMVD